MAPPSRRRLTESPIGFPVMDRPWLARRDTCRSAPESTHLPGALEGQSAKFDLTSFVAQ